MGPANLKPPYDLQPPVTILLKFKPSFLILSSNSNKTGVLFVCSKSAPTKSHNIFLPKGQHHCSSSKWTVWVRSLTTHYHLKHASLVSLHLQPLLSLIYTISTVSAHLSHLILPPSSSTPWSPGSCLSHLSCLPLKFINKCYWFRLPLPSSFTLVTPRPRSSSHLLPNVFYGVWSVKPWSHSFVVTSSVFHNVEKYSPPC